MRSLRTSFSDDLREAEGRLSSEIVESRSAFLTYQSDHLGVHSRRSEDTDRVHAELAKRLEAMTLIEARRAGMLAVLLVIIRTLGQNWQLIGVLLAALALVFGQVHVSFAGP